MTTARVRIEFKRIQTYLFAVPRLRTILGANALIGEAMRLNLPKLARECDCGLPPGLTVPKVLDGLECAVLRPRRSTATDDWTADNPAVGYGGGVLTRDGGHFQALFPSEDQAQQFASEAADFLGENLPGLTADIRIEAWQPHPSDRTLAAAWKERSRSGGGPLRSFFEWPGSPVCQWSGQGLAEESIDLGRGAAKETVAVSRQVKLQWDSGTRFGDHDTDDIVGLLQRATDEDGQMLLPCRTAGWYDGKDLESLAGGAGRYLALVHIDGNGVGKRAPLSEEKPPAASQEKEQALQRWLDLEAGVEAFFASMRQQVRAALVDALRATFGSLTGGGVRPYQLLMIGGDDLLLLCRAEYAFRFVVNYSSALADRPLIDGEGSLGIGAGVAIAQPTFPFHALNALAEELAASAKRLAREQPGRSVVDWMVVTNASALDPAEHRAQHDRIRYRLRPGGALETLLLTTKPYFVLPREGAADLQTLMAAADDLRQQRHHAARSQLKNLPATLRGGRRAAQHAVESLPQPIQALLKKYGLDVVWRAEYHTAEEDCASTRLADLVELTEIADLGRRQGLAHPPAAPTSLEAST